MARIPDDELEHLKREVSLARLIEGQGRSLIPRIAQLREPRTEATGGLSCNPLGHERRSWLWGSMRSRLHCKQLFTRTNAA